MKIRLIGVDLDGTLLNDSKTLCEGAEATLQKAAAQGVFVVPVTGRPLKGVPEVIRNAALFPYLITSNGAQIIDSRTGETLASFTIDNAKCRAVIRVLRASGCMFEPFADGVGYVQEEIFDYYLATFRGTPLEDYFFTSRVIENDIEGLFEGTDRRADEFFVNCSDAAVRARLTAQLDALGGLQYCLLAGRFLEITAVGCDKGAALTALCGRLGIPTDATAAFGDGENDLTLLAAAGLSVAMSNAFPVVKEKAAMVADTNNHNGVCQIIEQLLI